VDYENQLSSAANSFARGGYIDTDRTRVAEFNGGDLFNRGRHSGFGPEVEFGAFLRGTVLCEAPCSSRPWRDGGLASQMTKILFFWRENTVSTLFNSQ
jgi:hypothetical protein